MIDIILISLLAWSVWGFILRLQLTAISEEHKGFRYWLMTCSLGFMVLFIELGMFMFNGELKKRWDKFIRKIVAGVNHVNGRWDKFIRKIVAWVNHV